ncbi:MAG: hypothetical protein ACTTI7_00340 [Gemella haemolysans]|uniref:hypothetical protein n=1 Tax=Gemella haemolysans TaxID=1379 RepID=UPI003F9F39E8
MKIEDVQKANDLISELKKVDDLLKKSQLTGYCVEVSLADENIYLNQGGKAKILETVKEIRKDIIQELEKMGVEI